MTRLGVALVLDRFEGGPARAALTVALALDPEAYAHTVITGEPGALDSWAEESGVPVVRARGARALADALGDSAYDVVHTHGGTAGRIAAARVGVPRVVHTWYSPPSPSVAERRAARHTDVFLAVGARTASRALRLGLASPQRLRTIWPAVPLPDRAGTRTRARQLLGLPLGAQVVGGIGPARGARRPDVFARAIARLPSSIHGVWTDGDGGPAARLPGTAEPAAHRTPRWRAVAVAGPARRHRRPVAGVRRARDDRPSRGRALRRRRGRRGGVPLVGTVAPSGPDIIRAGETGLLTAPGDPGQLADAIKYLLDNPAEARRMSRAALKRVTDHCDPASLSLTLDEVYRTSPTDLDSTD